MAHEVERHLLDEDSALLISCTSQSWIQARRMLRVWTKIRDRQMEATVQYLDEFASAKNSSATSFVTKPFASHEEFDGEWAHQNAVMSKGEGGGDAPKGVVQELQEVFTIVDVTTLQALNARRNWNDERESMFDFQNGRGQQYNLVFPFLKPTAAVEAICMQTISETDLGALVPYSGFSFYQRRFVYDEETHTATFTIEFRQVAWNAWGHDSYDEDYYEYENAGTNNEKEVRVNTWVAIQNSDVKTAVDDLRAGNRTTAGYTLRGIRVSNRRNGSCDIITRERVIINGSDQLFGKEILRPFGWPHCIGTREHTWIVFEGYETHSDLLAAVGAAAAETPPATYTFVRFEDGKDGDGFYRRRYDYEKVTWTNFTDATPGLSTFKQVSERSTEGNGIARGHQACALDADHVDAEFAAITDAITASGYVLTSKGIQVQARGEFALTASETSVYSGTTAADALVVRVTTAGSDEGASAGALQRIWFRRTETARDTLITASTGEARIAYTFETREYQHRGFHVTDHHDGAYTVTQTLSYGPPIWWYKSRYDRTDEYLNSREKIPIRTSGGVENYDPAIRSEYIKIYERSAYGSEKAVSDAAWTWAKTQTSPHGHALVAGVFDPATGIDMNPVQGKVRYLGNDRWAAIRICFEDPADVP